MMDSQQLERNLQSIGKGCFVNYFMILSKFSIPDDAVAKYMSNEEGWNHASTLNIRVRLSREIIRSGRSSLALLNCAGSKGLPKELREKALEMIGDVDE